MGLGQRNRGGGTGRSGGGAAWAPLRTKAHLPEKPIWSAASIAALGFAFPTPPSGKTKAAKDAALQKPAPGPADPFDLRNRVWPRVVLKDFRFLFGLQI